MSVIKLLAIAFIIENACKLYLKTNSEGFEKFFNHDPVLIIGYRVFFTSFLVVLTLGIVGFIFLY